jgi:sodium-dependent dicarboxylate transporter 2/3/5
VTDEVERASAHRRAGLWLGLALATTILVALPVLHPSFPPRAARLVAVTALMAAWWVTEALPLGATALVPLATFPLLGVASAREVAPAYADPVVLLLLGGFLLALAVEGSGVHRRLALHVLLAVGASPRRLVLGFLAASAALSMWISNTATALIMTPVALAIAERAAGERPERGRGFTAAVLLAVAHGASIGGMGTPVGTPPNLISIGALERVAPWAPRLTFFSWALGAVPAVLALVPLGALVLTRVAPGVPRTLDLGATHVLRGELAALGPWRSEERRALALFGAVALAWIARPDIELGSVTLAGWGSRLGVAGADDATVAMLGAVVAFALPAGPGRTERLLPWSAVARLPWGLVLLFGGGMALSAGFVASGLSTRLGAALAGIAGGSPVLFLAAVVLAVTFATEVMSNTALANLALPILAATATEGGADPRAVMVGGALACSAAFMLPAATGPNAIAFGTGRVPIRTMATAGFVLNMVAWAVITVTAALAYLG